jgi:hypothetical protein
LETGLVERRDGASQPVVLQIEHVQSPKPDKRDRNLAGELVPGEVDDFEGVEAGEGGGKVAGEIIVVEKEGFEIEKAGEVVVAGHPLGQPATPFFVCFGFLIFFGFFIIIFL